MSPRRNAVLGALLAVACVLALPPAAGAARPRASLPDIEREVMCAACGVPLNIAESPQADRERAFIQGLIDQGQTKDQIKAALVAQYGRAVLATPSSGGFGVAAYAVPIALAIFFAGLLALLLPRWRRRGRAPSMAAGTGGAPPPPLSPTDASRLQADLDRFGR